MTTIVPRLDRAQLVQLLHEMSAPGHGDQESERMLLTFCLNTPDPSAALAAVLDAEVGTTDDEIARRALSFPPRHVSQVPVSELPAKHPLRSWELAPSW